MENDSSTDTLKTKPTYTTRSLLALTGFCGILLGWTVDHVAMSAKTSQLQARVARAERLEDTLERKFMTTSVVGRKVSDFPKLRLLVDHTLQHTDDAYRPVLDTITYPDVVEASPGHEIFYFDLTNTGIEGDPFDFYLLVSDGEIVRMRRGESLCL